MYNSVSNRFKQASRYYRAGRTVQGMYRAGKAVGNYIRYKLAPKRQAPPRKPRKAKSSKTNLRKQVSKIQQQLSTQMGTYTKKNRIYNSCITAGVGECAYVTNSFNSVTSLSAVIDAVKYFNPSVPGTLVSVDLTSPTFQQQVLFTKNYVKVNLRNNYSVPCIATIYILATKNDHSIAPDTSMSSSLTDMSNALITSPLIYPTDCHEFNDLWKIQKSVTRHLNPGQEVNLGHGFPTFKFDPPLMDDFSPTYQKSFHGSNIFIRVEGVNGHGATSGVNGLNAGVDVLIDEYFTVKYPAGVNVQYIEIVDAPAAIVGVHNVSQITNEQAVYAR